MFWWLRQVSDILDISRIPGVDDFDFELITGHSSPYTLGRQNDVSDWQGTSGQQILVEKCLKRVYRNKAIFRPSEEDIVGRSYSSVILVTVVDVGRFAVRTCGIDPNDIVGSSRDQLRAIRSIGKEGWTAGILGRS